MGANLENIEQAINNFKINKTVSCPASPAIITGSDSATAIESGDTLGNVFSIKVPPSGIIYSATLFDFDDKGISTDVMVFKSRIADKAVDDAYAPSDGEGVNFLTKLSFVSPTDHGAFQTFELTNIGKAYSAPNGELWFQAVTRGTPTVTAGSPYRIQIDILSDDPNWKG